MSGCPSRKRRRLLPCLLPMTLAPQTTLINHPDAHAELICPLVGPSHAILSRWCIFQTLAKNAKSDFGRMNEPHPLLFKRVWIWMARSLLSHRKFFRRVWRRRQTLCACLAMGIVVTYTDDSFKCVLLLPSLDLTLRLFKNNQLFVFPLLAKIFLVFVEQFVEESHWYFGNCARLLYFWRVVPCVV